MKIERILCPVDFSATSGRALDYAIGFAREFGATIHLVHSFQANPTAISPYGPVMQDDFVAAYRRGATEQVSKLRERVEAAGVDVETHLTQEFPSQAITQAAKENRADLIVMGTRGLTGLKHIVLGSVAERTLRIAPCPVLTVGGGEEGED